MNRFNLLKVAVVVVSTLSFSSVFAHTETLKNDAHDAAITTEIKSKLIAEKLFGDVPVSAITVHVDTKNGVVHLTGTAKNKDQVSNVEKVAKTVKGVDKVVNDVTVKE